MDENKSVLRPRARLMQHLGQDLIPNDRVALFELIKNSYDADASTVILRFAGRGSDEGSVEIWDDGHGMDSSTVRANWLEIANPLRKKTPLSESGRRRVLGAKGLGRFAVARLGSVTELTTRRRDGEEVFVRVDWEDFENDDLYLDDIEIEWTERSTPEVFATGGLATRTFEEVRAALTGDSASPSPAREGGISSAGTPAESAATDVTHGTQLRLSPLRGTWSDEDLSELTLSLSRLMPPAPPTELGITAVPDFQIVVYPHPDAEPEAIGPSPTIARPAYRLLGRVDATGQGRFAFTTTHAEADETFDVPLDVSACGPLAVDLRVWDLEAGALHDLRRVDGTNQSVPQIRKLIREASGVALYRDGFRVQPYGDTDYDWLGLDARRVNNPTMRLSNNQVVGFVFTTADDNPDLRDQANRQGLIENAAFENLRTVLNELLRLVEERRYELRRRSNPSEDPRVSRGGLFSAFNLRGLRETVSESHPGDSTLLRAIDRAEGDIERGVKAVQEVVSRFSRLSTLGSLVDVMLHEGNTALASCNFLIGRLHRLAEGAPPELAEPLLAHAGMLQQQIDALARLFRNLEPLSGRRRGRPRRVQLHDVLAQAVAVLENELEVAGVRVETTGPDRTVSIDVADVMQIVINLVRNAIYWTSTVQDKGQREVLIATSGSDDEVVIEVSDNGPGVPPERAHLIFDAYYTTREKGVGLGLNIAGTIASDFYDGDLMLVDNGPLPGATFRVTLRRRVG